MERNGRDVDPKESIVDRNGSIVDRTVNVTSDVTPSIFQLPTLSRKKFGQHFQPGRKLDFTPETLLEKLDCDNGGDKGNETELSDDEKIQLFDPLHIKQGVLRNLEIAFILPIPAITRSSRVCPYICARITGRTSYSLGRKIAKLLID